MRRFLPVLILICGLLTMPACNLDDMGEPGTVVDWYPVTVLMTATDSEGNSIVSPEMPGMSLTFKGKVYTVRAWSEKIKQSSVQTRDYNAILEGLFAQSYTGPKGEKLYRLWFGEIDGALDMDEDLTLHWPDGSVDIIHYHCSDHSETSCDRSWKLNGQDHLGNEFAFTGKSLQ